MFLQLIVNLSAISWESTHVGRGVEMVFDDAEVFPICMDKKGSRPHLRCMV